MSRHYFSKRRKRGDQSEQRFYLLWLDFHFRCLGKGRTSESGNFESALSFVAAYLALKRMQERHSAVGSPEADAHLMTISSGVLSGNRAIDAHVNSIWELLKLGSIIMLSIILVSGMSLFCLTTAVMPWVEFEYRTASKATYIEMVI